MDSILNAARKVSKCYYFEKLLASIEQNKNILTFRPSEKCLCVMKTPML